MRKLLLLTFFLSSIYAWALRPATGDSDFEASEDATHMPAMIMVDGADVSETISELEEQGVIILRHRKNILLALIPLDSPDDSSREENGDDDTDLRNTRQRLKKVKGVGRVEISRPRKIQPTMDHARLFNNAFLINEGKDIPSPFTGKGVVVGICDIGIDTRHPNFMAADFSESRIRRVVQYEELYGRRTVMDSPEDIFKWQTDNPDDWHGTHVAGIAAGRGMDIAVGEEIVNLRSLAPEADIVFTGSQLSDVGLLAGVEDIIEYATKVSKPAVINLSMGNYTGPHDGSSLFTRYLDLCAEDAIICISAGNEGLTSEVKAMRYKFTDAKPAVTVVTSNWDSLEATGYVEVWSPDETPFDFKLLWYSNTADSKNLDLYSFLRSDQGELCEWNLDLTSDSPTADGIKIFNDGYVNIECGISPLNKRYYAAMEFKVQTDLHHIPSSGVADPWAEYWPAIVVQGQPDHLVDIYAGGGCFLGRARSNPLPDNAMNISDLATGFKTISVGMMNNTEVDYVENWVVKYWPEGEVCPYSGYGTLIDGRKLPLTVAPGAYVYSSISSAYLDNHQEELQYVDYESDYNGEKFYWIGTLGTSMSCPFVVSAIATWLQAYPQLTSDQAIDIIRKTNQTEGYPDPTNPRHGQGWFDAYRGMQKVLDLAALGVGTVDASKTTLSVLGRTLHVGNPSGFPITVEIYTPEGRLAQRGSVEGTLGTYDLSALPKGIYLIRSAGQSIKVAL